MAAVVIIDDGHGLRVEMHHINQSNKSKVLLYKPLLLLFYFNIPFKQLYTSNKMESLGYKGVCSMHGSRCIEAFKRRTGLGYR